MNHRNQYASQWKNLLALIIAAAMIGLWGAKSYAADGDNTLRVSVGESVTLIVDDVKKLAIADQTLADVAPLSAKEINVIGKKIGVTTLTIIHNEKATQIYRVEIVNDAAAAAIRQLVGSKTLDVRTVGDVVVLDGYVNDELEAQRAVQAATALKGQQVLNLMEVRNPRQIKIRMRIAEVNRDAAKKIGFKWLGDSGQVKYAMGYTGLGLGSGAAESLVHGFVGGETGGGSAGAIGDDLGVQAVLQMLESKGYARLLSEPTLLTKSGTEASFLVGEERPIVQQLPNTFGVEFKEVGVRMKVTPTADSQNQIKTVIHAEVSQVSGTVGEFAIPVIATKKADTTLQVKNGQTIVIGGLLDNSIDQDVLRKLPWLGDIPVLGILFRHKEYHQKQTELLFFMTPEIVKDVDATTAGAARTPLMKDWTKKAGENVLETPKQGYDWGLHAPGRLGFDAEGLPLPEPPPAKRVDPSTNFTPARPAGR